jgi:hypothetical protein
MKNNYLFLICILVFVLIWSIWYYVLIESMETPELTPSSESIENTEKVSQLQEIMEKFSSDIAETIRNLIFTKTSEGEEIVKEDIAEQEQQIQNIEDGAKNTNKDITVDANALLENIKKKILEEETRMQEEETSRGISVEILNEQEKVRSIVNKYIQ